MNGELVDFSFGLGNFTAERMAASRTMVSAGIAKESLIPHERRVHGQLNGQSICRLSVLSAYLFIYLFIYFLLFWLSFILDV